MGDAAFYKCTSCGYEFLTKSKEPSCPKCKGNKLDGKDVKQLLGLDD